MTPRRAASPSTTRTSGPQRHAPDRRHEFSAICARRRSSRRATFRRGAAGSPARLPDTVMNTMAAARRSRSVSTARPSRSRARVAGELAVGGGGAHRRRPGTAVLAGARRADPLMSRCCAAPGDIAARRGRRGAGPSTGRDGPVRGEGRPSSCSSPSRRRPRVRGAPRRDPRRGLAERRPAAAIPPALGRRARAGTSV